jgi:hypothetical protein
MLCILHGALSGVRYRPQSNSLSISLILAYQKRADGQTMSGEATIQPYRVLHPLMHPSTSGSLQH